MGQGHYETRTCRLYRNPTELLFGRQRGPKHEIRRSPNVSFNKSNVARATCDMSTVLLKPHLLHIMVIQFGNETNSNHGSIPITIDWNVLATIVFGKIQTNDSTSP
ncbi:hypothetical protein EVAR_68299_1 [Eumeta japonica]|uniref:Uncharacterized protein n=1 Tax=Eumeta variegata TaxID=151549 RepID=A0A4C2ADA7_EUMVA|nr:hypothetical protein EVAR_68299_1 [Eumeta japonica]